MSRDQITARRPLCALVTGASSGIGRSFAELLAEKQQDLVVVARREELLRELAEEIEARFAVSVTVLVADLADPAAPSAIARRLAEDGREVDVLVNNAGYTMDGHMLSYDWEEHRAYNQVMALAPAELTYRLLPGMLERGFGQVVNIASAAALMPSTPFNTFYGPCKQHMVTLTRGLQIEYGQAGVTFSACCPGPVKDTAILETQHGETWSRFTFLLNDVREVAERAYAAVEKGKTVEVVGASSKALPVFGRLLPADTWSRTMGRGVMFLGKEKRISSAGQAGVHDREEG
jgi:uncharacterized protein